MNMPRCPHVLSPFINSGAAEQPLKSSQFFFQFTVAYEAFPGTKEDTVHAFLPKALQILCSMLTFSLPAPYVN